MRVDLYLHHVRIFKTRSLATKACDKSQVKLAGQSVKPAYKVKVGDLLNVQRGDLHFVLRVTGFPAHRVGAPLTEQYMENLTPVENYQRAAEARQLKIMTAPYDLLSGATKPDKKQRREIQRWMDEIAAATDDSFTTDDEIEP